MKQSELLPIKQFSQLCRSTPRTLRFYEHHGLIKPAFIDPKNRYRYYDPHQAKEFFKIRLLNNFHIPLREIPNVLTHTTYENFIRPELEKLRLAILEQQKEYQFLKTIKKFLFTSKKPETFMQKDVFGPYVLFCTRDEKGRYDRINSIVYKLKDMAKELKIPVTDRQMVFYLDPVAYKPKDTRLEICVVCKKGVATGTKLPKGYYFKTYPKTNVRTYTYKGPFEYIVLIYQKLHEEHTVKPTLERNELGFDLYISGPWNKKSEYDFVTKIAFPAE